MLATHSLISSIGPCQPRRSPLTYIVANRFEQIMCVSVCCSFPNRRCDDSVPGSIACWSAWSASWTHWAQSWKHRSDICSSRVNPYTTRFFRFSKLLVLCWSLVTSIQSATYRFPLQTPAKSRQAASTVDRVTRLMARFNDGGCSKANILL